MFGSQTFQYYDGSNLSYIPFLDPDAAAAGNTDFDTAPNATTAANTIFSAPESLGNGPNTLYTTGYMKQAGGSAIHRYVESVKEGEPIAEHRYSIWSSADPVCDFAYRKALYYLQNDLNPLATDLGHTQYKMDPRNVTVEKFNEKVHAKPGAIAAGIV
jgi:hypothetical protein